MDLIMTVPPEVSTPVHPPICNDSLSEWPEPFAYVYIFSRAAATVPPPGYVCLCELYHVYIYIHSLSKRLRELWDFEASPPHGRFLESLKRYRLDLDTLFTLLKDCQRSVKVLTNFPRL